MNKKYLFLAIFLVMSFAQAKTQYVSQTLVTYSTQNDMKPSGKILPTTPLEVLKVQGNKAFIKLTGWNQGKMTRILYFSKGERIISAAFSKKAKYEIKKLETLNVQGSKKSWTKVTLTTWVDNKNIVKDIKPLYEQASNLLQTNCGLCHAYHPTEEFSANQWPSVIKGMLPRTPLSKEESLLIIQYAQKHAKK